MLNLLSLVCVTDVTRTNKVLLMIIIIILC